MLTELFLMLFDFRH